MTIATEWCREESKRERELNCIADKETYEKGKLFATNINNELNAIADKVRSIIANDTATVVTSNSIKLNSKITI